MVTLSDKLSRTIADNRLDELAAFVGLILAMLMLPLRLIASNAFLKTVPIVLGAACLVFLYATRSRDQSGELLWIPFWASRLLASLSFVAIGALGIIGVRASGRSLTFLVLSGAITSVLLAQILFTRRENLSVRLLLVELFALVLVIRFTALLTTPGFIGVDVWTHVTTYSRSIQQAGSLEPISDVKYYVAPLYHLLVVATAEVLDTSLRTALFASMGLLMAFAPLFLYETARFFVSVRWSLAAVTLFASSDWVVRWSTNLSTNSLGILFFLVVLYGLARLFHADDDLRTYALLVVAIVGVVLTHQVSAFIVLVLLGTGVFVQLVTKVLGWWPYRPGEPVNLIGLFAFDLVFSFGMWSITPLGGKTFLQRVIEWFGNSMRTSFGFLNLPETGGSAGGPSATTSVVPYIDALGLLLLLFVAVIGSLACLRRRRVTQSRLTLIASIVVLLAFVFVLPLFGIRALLPSRWVAFAYAPMAVVGAIGLQYLSRNLEGKAVIGILLVFLVATPTAMMVSGNGTMDRPVFETENVRYSYSSAELEAVADVGQLRSERMGPVYTDHPYRTVFNRSGSYEARRIRLSESGRPEEYDTVIYRTYQSDGAPNFLVSKEDLTIKRFARSEICRPEMNRVYSNDDVSMCTVDD